MTAGPPLSAPPPVVKPPTGPAATPRVDQTADHSPLGTVMMSDRTMLGAAHPLRVRARELLLALRPARAVKVSGPPAISLVQWPRPKSLSGLMVLGLALIAVPLLWAIITALIQMRTLTTTGQKVAMESATASRVSQQLSSQVASVERTARVYDLEHKVSLLAVYHSSAAELEGTRQQLGKLASAPVMRSLNELDRVKQSIDQIVDNMKGDPLGSHKDELGAHFSQMSDLVDRIAKQTNEQIDEQLNALHAQATTARTQLILESTLLLPLTLLAIFGLTVVVGRPLKHLDRVISDLGEKKNLSRPIEVPGPHDLERLGKKLEWLRVRMLDLDNERSRFMRHMSHELKTPLAAITDGTELLMDGTVGTLDPAQQEVMEILREKSKSLQEMIDNLLSFTAWQTSRVGLVPGEFALRSIVKQVIENHRIIVLRQRIRLDLGIDDITVIADRSKFRLIIENLVSNALKYSPKGGTIHIKGREEGSQLVLDVADHGPGIAMDEREQIFEAFFTGRAAKSRKSSLKGTGIGLSVVLEFVSAHQGRIEIIDGEYPGAHFRVTMPLRLESDPGTDNEKARPYAA